MAQTPVERSRGARVRSARATSMTVSNAELHELARSKRSVRDFVEGHALQTKSEVGVDQAKREAKRAGSKQAWAPPKRQNLSSSSARFQHKSYKPLPPHPSTPLPSSSHEDASSAKADDSVHIEHLEKLKDIFDRAAKQGNGKLDVESFMKTCDTVFDKQKKNEEHLRIAFKKIDSLSHGSISWDDFCTFLYLEFRERDKAETRAKTVEFHVPAKTTVGTHHHGSVCAVRHLSDGALVSCSEEGTVCVWSPDMKLRRSKTCQSVIKASAPQRDMDLRTKPKWISDMALSLAHKKIILTTGDCEMQFFEMVNFEPYCQLKQLESIPIKIVCWHDPEDDVKTVILVGDKDGAVMVLIIDNILDAFQRWKSGPKSGGLPSYSLHKLITSNEAGVRCYRWKLHSSWVTELHYFSKLLSFASCSSDSVSSLVLGSLTPSTEVSSLLRQLSVTTTRRSLLPAKQLMACDQRVFSIAKGVSSADYCPKHNVIVTGSVDRLVRIWNPFMNTKPIGVLEGHTAPVFFVRVDSSNYRVYSIGNDNTIMVWDTVEFTCLKTVIPSAHKFYSPTQAAHFNDVSHQLVLATDEVAVVQLVLHPGMRQGMVQSHSSPIVGATYSACFNHLITACRNGVVKVWDMCSGKKTFEFSVGTSGISTIDIDKSGKRIVTGSPNGEVKIWSYNSGECLKTLDKENRREVTRIRFVSVNQIKYIVAVGWDKRVTLFPDVSDTIQEVYKPLNVWSTRSESVHKTDIMTVAFGTPHFMATASFCGKIVVWSLISYTILNQLKAAYPISSNLPSSLEGDEAVQDLVFLDKRTKSKLSASLVASGPAGHIHFWNISDALRPMACFRASNYNCVTSLAVDSNNLLLLTGDIEGFLCLWSIENYCVHATMTVPPKRVVVWRAHTQRITQLLLVEQWNAIVSAAADTSVRVWTLEGNFIGTFGQENTWKLGEPTSYQHPMMSTDLLSPPDSASTPHPTHGSHRESEDSKNTLMLQTASRKSAALQQAEPEALKVTEMEEECDTDLLQPYGISLDASSTSGSIHGPSQAGKWLRHCRIQSAKYRTAVSPQKVYRLLPFQTIDKEELPIIVEPYNAHML